MHFFHDKRIIEKTDTKKGEQDRMRDRIQRFMWGRYGNDRFNQFLMVAALLCMFLSFFGLRGFYGIAFLIMIYAYYRMFSRQTAKRAAENQWYLKKEWKVRSFFAAKKKQWSQRKIYRIYKCPQCGQKLRVPRGKGKIAIRCKKCGNEFIRKS